MREYNLSTPQQLQSGQSRLHSSHRSSLRHGHSPNPNALPAPRFVIAIAENHAREIGIAALQIDTAEVLITQIADNPVYSTALTLIYGFDPMEIYVSNTLEGSLLVRKIQKQLDIEVHFLSRALFNETTGEAIYKTAHKRTQIPAIDKKYLAL